MPAASQEKSDMRVSRESLLEELPDTRGCGHARGRPGLGRRAAVLSVALLALLLAWAFARPTALASASSSSPVAWGSPQSVDALAPYTEPNGFLSMSCASGTQCVGVTGFGDIVSSTDPTGSSASDWSVLPSSLLSSDATGYGLAAVSCTTGFCATGGTDPNHSYDGVILTSSDPTGGSASDWTNASISDSNAIQFIQCQSSSSCIAVDDDDYVLSYDGTSWSKSSTPLFTDSGGGLTGLSCPSSSLCMASDYSGDVYISDTPSDLSTAWTEETSSTTGVSDGVGGVSCSSASDCALLASYEGEAAYTTDASSPTPTWTAGTAATGLRDNVLNGGLTCVNGTTACLAGVSGGSLFASTNGGSTFAQASGFPSSIGNAGAIGCAGSSLCAAGTDQGYVSSSTDPTDGGSSTWSSGVLSAVGLNSVQFGPSSCPSGTLCVGADSQGRLFTGTPGSFTETSLADADGLGAPICPSTSLCMDTNGTDIFSSTDPGSGGASWRDSAADPGGDDYIGGFQCPSAGLCVGYAGSDKVISSTSPGGSSWNVSTNPVVNSNDQILGLACPSTSLCVGIADDYNTLTGSYVFASTTPGQVSSGWSARATPVDSDYLQGIVCPSSSLCVAYDGSGNVLTSTDPAANSWSSPVDVDSGQPIVQLACPSSTLCVGYDGKGDLLTSTDPAGGASAWSVSGAPIDTSGINQLVCSSASLCLLSDNKGDVVESADPAGGASTWTTAGIDTGHRLMSLACAGTTVCVASDDSDHVIEGTPSSTTTPSSASGAAGKAKVSGTKVTDTLSCHGGSGQSCTFKMALTVVETLRGKKVIAVAASKRKKKTVTAGSKTVTLAAGTEKKETVALNRVGRSLLKKRGKLPVSFTVSQGKATLHHQTIHFKSKTA